MTTLAVHLVVSASSVIVPDEFLPNAQITILLLSIVFVVIVGDDPVPEVDEESVIVNILVLSTSYIIYTKASMVVEKLSNIESEVVNPF